MTVVVAVHEAIETIETTAVDAELGAAATTVDDEQSGRRADRMITAGIGIAVLVAWEVAARTYFADRYVLSAPTSIVAKMWTDRELLRRNGSATVKIAVQGFVFGQLVAVGIALVASLLARAEQVITRLALVAYSLPTLALAPILGTIFDRHNTRVVVVALIVFFPTLISMVSGLASVSPETVQMVRSLGGSRLTVLRKVRWRASLPSMLSGFKVGVSGAMLGAIASEWLGADSGLGIFMVNALGYLEPSRVWAICTTCVLITMLGYLLVGLAERLLMRWSTGGLGRGR